MATPVSGYDLVIFDNDGVLIDSAPLALGVVVGLMNEMGWFLTMPEAAELFLGNSLGRAIELATERGFTVPESFTRTFQERFFESYRLHLQATPGVTDVLEHLTVPSCAVSGASKHQIALGLGLTGLLHHFEGRIISGDDVAQGKPAPDLFLLAAHTMGVAPERCIVIDDSALGIEAGNQAGMATIGFAAIVPPDRLAAANHGVVRSMYELLSVLR
jgi:HAD superfamily hydrolase (TIGR01509 family)